MNHSIHNPEAHGIAPEHTPIDGDDCSNCGDGFYEEELVSPPDGGKWCRQCVAEHFGFGSPTEMVAWLNN